MKNRDEILKRIADRLEPMEEARAMWECGSVTFHRIDEWSDLDIVIEGKEGTSDALFMAIEKALRAIAPIDATLEPSGGWPGVLQKIYRLEGMSPYHVIEVAIVAPDAPTKFLEREIHGDIPVHFDKDGVTQVAPIEAHAWKEKLEVRVEDLIHKVDLYRVLVEKEIHRGNHMEAMAFYQGFIQKALVELIRIRYSPFRYNFQSRYLYYDLPETVIERLEPFFFIGSPEELGIKFQEAMDWMTELNHTFLVARKPED
jgi:predicted nucleotidyltransferase